MELSIELADEIIGRIRALASRHYGDSGDAAVGRVVESALTMRLLSMRLAQEGAANIEEPIAEWEFADSQLSRSLPGNIQGWLFRKGGS